MACELSTLAKCVLDSGMKFRQLEYAVRLAQTLSFREAAELCHVAQPTLSNGVAALETELGGRLFERTTREVRLTSFGLHVLPFLQTMLADRDELAQAVRTFQNPDHKILRIGMSPLIDLKTVERALTPFRTQFPDVNILFKECLVDDLTERLLYDKLDMGLRVVDLLPDGLEGYPAYSEPLCYLPQGTQDAFEGRRDWRIADLPERRIICTNGTCGLNGALERLFHSEGRKLELYPGFALSYQAIEEWTDLGIGAAILPESKISAASPTAGRLLCNDGMPARFYYEWVFRRTRYSTTPSHVSAFQNHVTKVAPALLRS